MIQIENTLVSDELLEKYFSCDLEKCRGMCCIKGDAGAPLNDEELVLLSESIEKIKPFLRKEGNKAIEQQGTYVVDDENETVTPLIDGNECAYTVFDKGIARCGIEHAFLNRAIDFQKPVSCHLYPVRLKKLDQFTAVNYDVWDICNPARTKGEKEKMFVCKFVSDALVRKFGKKWVNQLNRVFLDRQKPKCCSG